MSKHKKMATRPKANGRIVQEHIENAIAVSIQGRRKCKSFHQTAHDLNEAKNYMEFYGLFETIEEILKSSQFGEAEK